MPSDPVAAGRKGGSACTDAQNEARRRNGFQKRTPEPQPDTTQDLTPTDEGEHK